ncbi:MAG: hypothetical protein JWR13_3501, partial [Mycobacterium sp.]|nr:hypothetical protein [Mycobacterium sp.]
MIVTAESATQPSIGDREVQSQFVTIPKHVMVWHAVQDGCIIRMPTTSGVEPTKNALPS